MYSYTVVRCVFILYRYFFFSREKKKRSLSRCSAMMEYNIGAQPGIRVAPPDGEAILIYCHPWNPPPLRLPVDRAADSATAECVLFFFYLKSNNNYRITRPYLRCLRLMFGVLLCASRCQHRIIIISPSRTLRMKIQLQKKKKKIADY